ncbi:MAG: YggT family protein [Acidobacteria bacterium]|nr:YggT family protein [Acidobacteriota bacterium]MCB9398202.1 YggT family protein [Acidobacteriota bacterium]
MTQGIVLFKQTVLLILYYGLEAYFWLLIVRMVASFFVQNRYAAWYVFVTDLTDPPLRLIRKWTRYKLVMGNLDFSAIILFMAIKGAQTLLVHFAINS